MSFFNADNSLNIIYIVLLLITIILLCFVLWMYFKLRRFLKDADAENILLSLEKTQNELKKLESFENETEAYLTDLEKRVRKSVQSVQTIRFNPFKGTGGGGNQSFATAFLNEEGDGVIISSLYSREHVSVFSKPVKNKSSEHELSEEEKEALDNAIKNI